MQARALAAEVLAEVMTQHHTLTSILPKFLERLYHEQDRAFVQEMCYGVMRWYYRLEAFLAAMLEKDMKLKYMDVKMLMLIGIYQLTYMQVPEHAAVSATVAACDDLHKPWAKKLVNAILRRYQRGHAKLQARLETNIEVVHAHPGWMIKELQNDLPQHWLQVLTANNERPPMFLRTNRLMITPQEYLDKLKQAGIAADVTAHSPVGIKLVKPIPVDYLPGFKDGLVSVQDLAAQLAVPLLEPVAGQHILDACAAPGGKLAHLLETTGEQCTVTAVEKVPARVEKLKETLHRLRVQAKIIEADARTPATWWDGNQFDRILLDAPCSASGVIRRHPDIKVLRTAKDMHAATLIQSDLLEALWPLLKSGGKLLYSTCSVLTCENETKTSAFIAAHNDAKTDTIHADWGLPTACGRQIISGQEDMDGFYYARLEKV